MLHELKQIYGHHKKKLLDPLSILQAGPAWKEDSLRIRRITINHSVGANTRWSLKCQVPISKYKNWMLKVFKETVKPKGIYSTFYWVRFDTKSYYGGGGNTHESKFMRILLLRCLRRLTINSSLPSSEALKLNNCIRHLSRIAQTWTCFGNFVLMYIHLALMSLEKAVIHLSPSPGRLGSLAFVR